MVFNSGLVHYSPPGVGSVAGLGSVSGSNLLRTHGDVQLHTRSHAAIMPSVGFRSVDDGGGRTELYKRCEAFRRWSPPGFSGSDAR